MALTGQEFAQGVQGANLAAQAMQQPWQDREQMQMLQSIYNDPNYQGKPVSEILSAAGKKFLGTNSWKTGLGLMEKSDLAQMREARASQAQQVELQNTLDSMSNDLTSIDDTNEEVGRQQANAYIDQYMNMSPKLAQQGQRAKMLLNSGNMNVATFKQKIKEGFLMPFDKKLQMEKQRIDEKRADAQIEHYRALEDQSRANAARAQQGLNLRTMNLMFQMIKDKASRERSLTQDEWEFYNQGLSLGLDKAPAGEAGTLPMTARDKAALSTVPQPTSKDTNISVELPGQAPWSGPGATTFDAGTENKPTTPTPQQFNSLSFDDKVRLLENSAQNETGSSGEKSMMQVMPDTFKKPGYGVRPGRASASKAETPDDLDEWERVGRDYSRAMLNKYNGNERLAAIAYNMGAPATDAWIAKGADESKLPQKTRDYIDRLDRLSGAAEKQPVQDKQPLPVEKAVETASRTLPGKKGAAGREARYQDVMAIAGSEAAASIGNLVNMPMTVSGGVLGYGATKSNGMLDAPIQALKNRMTTEDVQRYNREIDNVGAYYARLLSGGLTVTQADIDKFTNQFKIREGDSELTKMTTLGQMRQTFERAAQVKINSKATPPEQIALWKDWLSSIRRDIPFTVKEVNAVANSRNPKETIGQAMQRIMGGKASVQSPEDRALIEKYLGK